MLYKNTKKYNIFVGFLTDFSILQLICMLALSKLYPKYSFIMRMNFCPNLLIHKNVYKLYNCLNVFYFGIPIWRFSIFRFVLGTNYLCNGFDDWAGPLACLSLSSLKIVDSFELVILPSQLSFPQWKQDGEELKGFFSMSD